MAVLPPRLGRVVCWSQRDGVGFVFTHGNNKEELRLPVDNTSFEGAGLRTGGTVDVYLVEDQGNLKLHHMTGEAIVKAPHGTGKVVLWDHAVDKGYISAQQKGTPPRSNIIVNVRGEDLKGGTALMAMGPVTFKPVYSSESNSWHATEVEGDAVFRSPAHGGSLTEQYEVHKKCMQWVADRANEACLGLYHVLLAQGRSEDKAEPVELPAEAIQDGCPATWKEWIRNNIGSVYAAVNATTGELELRLRITAVHTHPTYGEYSHSYWVNIDHHMSIKDTQQEWEGRFNKMHAEHLAQVKARARTQVPDAEELGRKRDREEGDAGQDEGSSASPPPRQARRLSSPPKLQQP
eukprot:TRINITY_DN16437_c0_g2_i1.p2 TRINITY_DN16437_c0_g2~~TRINITY_DN16437_c0_g2_i1.p2  ORF type:complete len:349 (+),score=110.00 TRINITY_DN16437_c0_g2_i1:74-1120(+)